MPESTHSTGIRTRALGAALATLGCSLGVSLTPEMLAAPKPAPAERSVSADHIKFQADQMKHDPVLAADKAALEADQIKLRDFESSLTPETRRLAANQHKLSNLRAAVAADQHKLEADYIKIDASPSK